MNEIKCPNCGEVFQIDQADYANILSQVRNEAFEAEIASRVQAVKKQMEAEAKLAMETAVSGCNLKITELESRLNLEKAEYEKQAHSMEELHRKELKLKDEEISQIKNFKHQQSVKLLGESLEQHCAMTFQQYQMMAFPNAVFEKDNTAVEGTKGDFIYREELEGGAPLLSIMFEMKTESDASTHKHKNADFFDKLDKDRAKKKCEYAVLVSTLEADNEYYNTGIVPVPGFEKMYAIRPQFFITLIFLLRQTAVSTADVRKELAEAKKQDMDVQMFADSMQEFKDKFALSYNRAKNHFDTAIEEINKTIDHLQKVREELLSTSNNLRIANDKAQDMSIKKLTRKNPTMRGKFLEAGVDIT